MPSFSRRVSKPASKSSTRRTCPGSTISTAYASLTRSSSHSQIGRGEGTLLQRRGWPSQSAGRHRELPSPCELRRLRAAALRVSAGAAVRTGGGLCRPRSSPAHVLKKDGACAASPRYLHDRGGFGRIPEDVSGRTERRNRLSRKPLWPKVTRHQPVRNTRSKGSSPAASARQQR